MCCGLRIIFVHYNSAQLKMFLSDKLHVLNIFLFHLVIFIGSLPLPTPISLLEQRALVKNDVSVLCEVADLLIQNYDSILYN